MTAMSVDCKLLLDLR